MLPWRAASSPPAVGFFCELAAQEGEDGFAMASRTRFISDAMV
jgi:hypothetical protein